MIMFKTWYKIAKNTEWINIDSSFIEKTAYYPSLKIMDLRLKGGREYTFIDIPQSTFDRFLNSTSKGKFFNEIIKRKYDFKQL